MREVTVEKAGLLERIRKNREGHRAAFEKAFKGYKAALEEELARKLEQVRAGKLIDQYIRLPIPEDHTDDYDQVILMLEMEVNEEITIDYQTFRQYVMDEWAWKQTFTATNAHYGA